MRFGPVASEAAAGAVLAHSLRVGGRTLRKGTVLDAADVRRLVAAGVEEVTVVALEADDVPENDAALALAGALAGDGLARGRAFTGRCNVTATAAGVARIDVPGVDALNMVNEAVTLSTVAPWSVVRRDELVATAKIIPFAAAREHLERCLEIAANRQPVRLAPFRPLRMGLLQTTLPGFPASLLEKSVAVTRGRVEALEGRLVVATTCAHTAGAVGAALGELGSSCDLVLVLGASATVDRRDVVPAGVVAAGGELVHFGMPVDPGNLLLLARVGDVPVLGIPGSGRSPRWSGIDAVLARLAAGCEVGGPDVMRMGAGGLLKEIATRPMPRSPSRRDAGGGPHARVAAVVLAAGRSRRMGDRNKMLVEVDGKPMVRHAAEAATSSRASEVVVVVGHEADAVRDALAGVPVRFVTNPRYPEGLSTSLAAGLASLGPEIQGAVVCLADMPRVRARHIDRLISAFDPDRGAEVCVPTWNGKRGNPVLWGRRLFEEMARVHGDVGARHLIGEYPESVREVPMDDDAVVLDVDSPQALAALVGPERDG